MTVNQAEVMSIVMSNKSLTGWGLFYYPNASRQAGYGNRAILNYITSWIFRLWFMTLRQSLPYVKTDKILPINYPVPWVPEIRRYANHG